MPGYNPYAPPNAHSRDDEQTDIPYDEPGHFLSEPERLFYVVWYALGRAGEEEALERLAALGEKLSADEGAHLAELEAFVTKSLLQLRNRFSKTDFFNESAPNPLVLKILTRYELQYLIDEIDETSSGNYVESARLFLSEASRDFSAALERADAELTHIEDLTVSDVSPDDETEPDSE